MNDECGVRLSRPSIWIDGTEDTRLADRLVHLRTDEQVDGMHCCEATFGNWGAEKGEAQFAYFDEKKLFFGRRIEVRIGDATAFSGRITALEGLFHQSGPPEIVVLAEDAFQDLRMVRRTRSFEEVTDQTVFESIAREHSLQPDVSLRGPTHKVLAQVNQSDLAFLRERARTLDAELWIGNGTLSARPRADRTGDTLALSFRSEIREFDVVADLAQQRTSLAVNGWDVAGKDAITHESDATTIAGELEGDRSGPQLLQDEFGTRKESIAHAMPASGEEARAEAESAFRRTARRFVRGHGVAEANGDLRVGRKLDVAGLGPWFSGKYYVTEVRHLFDTSDGLRTTFSAERAGIGRPDQRGQT